ncbi:MAG: hypothetical protein V9E96_04530 [Chitinophagaceae bacterium]|jgi:hypothetical protein
MNVVNSFVTYNGYCHLMIDKIVLSAHEDPKLENFDNYNIEPNLFRLLFSSIVFAICIAAIIVGFSTNNFIWGSYAIVFASLALYYFYRVIVFTQANIIYTNTILKIQFLPSIYPIQQAHFLVTYKSGYPIQQKRKIYLTNCFANNDDVNIKNALEIVEEEFG